MKYVFPNLTGTLEEFARWYKENDYPIRPPFEDCVYVTDNSYSYVLFRQGQFQAEIYLVKPNSGSPEHSHPNVENIILVWGGDAYPSYDGVASPAVTPVARADGTSSVFGSMNRKMTDDHTHALQTGPKGAAFLSIEKWPANAKPTSVVVNWKGAAVGEYHATQINELPVARDVS